MVTVAGFQEYEQVLRHVDQSADSPAEPERTGMQNPPTSRVGPFILGTVVGGLAGAVVGTALSPHTRGFLIGLYHLVNRRLASSEHDQLRFELLLQ
jgi:hypothetical protein